VKKLQEILPSVGIVLVILIILSIVLPYFYSPMAQPERAKTAQSLALLWLSSNFTPQTGLFTYALNPHSGEFSLENNAIRQLMASRILAEQSSKSSELLELHTVNIEYLIENWFKEDKNGGYVLFDEKSKLGANAMLLRTLIASPLFDSYSTEAKSLAKGILHLQKTDGSFSPWYVEPNYEYNEAYILTFYSGEALLALVEYYEKTNDSEYLDAAKLSAKFYIQEYATDLEENYYPAYVPWHSIALNKLYKITGDKTYAGAIFTMTDKLLEIQDTTTIQGRFYNPATPEYGRPHAASDAVYTEGLAYAYEVAVLVDDTEKAKQYEKAMWLGVKNLLSLQYTQETESYPLPAYTYVGGFQTNLVDPYIRVDNTQHAHDALTKILSLEK